MAIQTKPRKHQSDNILESGITRDALINRIGLSSLRDHLTFKTVVAVLGCAAFLIFLGSVVSARIAFLFVALLGIFGLMLFEMSSRRRWEAVLAERLRKMNDDYDRLVREAARNRNDLAVLKKALAGAGSLARSYGNLPPGGVPAEQRMIKAMAEQLAKLGDSQQTEEDPPVDLSALNFVTPEKNTQDDTQAWRHLTDEQVLQIVHAAVRHDRVDLFLQPIVNLPQRKPRFFEMFSRIRIKPDVYLPAERYIEVAMKHDLAPVIDNLLMLRGLQLIRDGEETDFNRAFFCNITSLTLNDPKFMGDLVEFIAQHRALAPRLVFEMGQRDMATTNADIIPVLDGLAHLGCRFSMDQVKSLSFDFAFLEARHVRFVKVDAALMLREMKEAGGFQRLKRLKAEMDANGIDLIVEKIETDRQLLDLLDVEIDYGQGWLFGRPALAGQQA